MATRRNNFVIFTLRQVYTHAHGHAHAHAHTHTHLNVRESLGIIIIIIIIITTVKIIKIKSVAYSSQGSQTGQLDFCNWLADSSTTG